MPEKLNFKISSALKTVIGKDLITDDFVAIFELVKNSFDAGANNVLIQFNIGIDENDSIYIIDDGKGMDKSDLINKWLFVAFSAKKNGEEDKERKNYSGHKGIGRFSSDRLGSVINIQTKTKNDNTINFLNVNWDNFDENIKDEFIFVDVNYDVKNNFQLPNNVQFSNANTVLEIKQIRNKETWDRKKLIKLKQSLSKLIDPIEQSKNIKLVCESEIDNDKEKTKKSNVSGKFQEIVNGNVVNNVFKILENKTTKLFAEIDSMGFLNVEIRDRGTFIYRTKESIIDDFDELVDASFYAEMSYLNRSAKLTFSKRMGLSPVAYGSIFLIRNGFRVFPIGEEGNDYWGIDRRKQQGYARFLGTRDLLGFIRVSGNEDKFKESSSRNSGLVKTKAAKQIEECFMRCLRKFESYVVDVTWRDKIDKDYTTFERMELDDNRYLIIDLIEKLSNSKNIDVVSYNDNIISILSKKSSNFEPSIKKLKTIAEKLNDEELIKQVARSEKNLLKLKIAQQKAELKAYEEKKIRLKVEEDFERVNEEKDEIKNEYEEEIKRNLFLVGSTSRDKETLECFIHQIIEDASNSKSIISNAIRHCNDKRTIDYLSDLQNINDKIITTSKIATSANFRLKSGMITEDLNSFIEQYINEIAKAYNTRISIKTDISDKEFVYKFNPIKFGIIIENLISNSNKARSSYIRFNSKVIDNILLVTVEDNGKGIDKSIIDKQMIFSKGYTRTRGSGLGLYFCKQQINDIGGEIFLDEKQPKNGARFIMKVGKSEN